MNTSSNRYSSEIYDSIQQAGSIKFADESHTSLWLGRLRLDSFLFGKVVIKDAEILNGVFFLNAAVEGRVEDLPWERMEIVSRATSLDEALLRLVRPSGDSRLRGVFFWAFPLEVADQIRVSLNEYPAKDVNDWRQLPRILRELGANASNADKLDTAWQKLMGMARGHSQLVVPWDSTFNFPDHFDEHLGKDEALVLDALHTPLGKGIGSEVWHKRADRGPVLGILRQADADANIEEQADLATLYTWYNCAYNRTLQQHHKIVDMEIAEAPGCRPTRPDQRQYDLIKKELQANKRPSIPAELVVNIPAPFLKSLGDLKKIVFDRLLDDHERNLTTWRANRDMDGLRRAVDGLVDAVDRLVGLQPNIAIPHFLMPMLRTIPAATGAGIGAKLGDLEGTVYGCITGEFIGGGIEIAAEGVLARLDTRNSASRCIIERATSLAACRGDNN
jgi:hypothetical protein